jgi:UDP-N-acetylmuramate: L-alanyl-gamma-D-glutamyl-meso-diaminopimelate ligase
LPPENTLPQLAQIRHVHLIAVCGTAMGTLARMLAESGLRVTGSDKAAYPPMSEQLAEAGIDVWLGFRAEHVREPAPDLVVIGNAVSRDNPEAQAVMADGTPYVSMSDAIAHFFIRDRHSLVITGTHGKTTSTSLLGWILAHAGRDPGVLVGGVAGNFSGGYRLGKGPQFVIEGDEYDTAFFDKTPKFLHYRARSALLTSCEFDHADIYGSIEAIRSAFRQLLEALPSDGRLVAADQPGVRLLLPASRAPVETYGLGAGPDWSARGMRTEDGGTRFELWRGKQQLGSLWLPLFGAHNVENALGVSALAMGLGLELREIAAALREFRGVRRRQEVRGEAAGSVVIDDFAHHPTAVRETIAAMRARYPDRTLWAVFEPRTNTNRRRFFENEYIEAFAGADRVIWSAVHDPERIPEADRMRPERVMSELGARGVDARYLASVDRIIEDHLTRRTGHDAVLIMSNGDFGGICERLLAELASAERSKTEES